MSRYTGRNAQRLIQAKAGFVSVAALLCLSAPIRLTAQPAATEGQQPSTEQSTPATPAQTQQPPAPAAQPAQQPPAAPTPPSQQTTTPTTPPAATTPPGTATQIPPDATTPGTTPLPTVSVTGNRPQAPARPAAAAPAQQAVQTPPAPPAQPVQAAATAAAANPFFSPSYQASTLGVGRIGTNLLDTPQTVNVVPQAVIREQNVSTVKDALRNVAGVTFRAGEGGNQGDTPYIRGFSAQNDIFRDGVRDPGWYTRDAFAVDAVEVYKGPASVLFGRGSTGGVINLISKTPFERNAVEGTITGNSGPGTRATIDANGKVGENLWARLVTMGQMYDIPGRDHVEQNRYGFSPSLMYKPSDQTKITLAYIYQHDNNVPDYGIPFLSPAWGIPRNVAPVARSTWYGILSGPTPDTEVVTAQIGTVKIEHEFNNNVKITNITRLNDVDRLQRNVFPEPNASVPPPPNLNANWTPNRAQIHVRNQQFVNQTDVLLSFSTGPWMEHKVALGYDITRESRDFLRNNFADMAPTNFLEPDPWRWGGVALAPTAGQILQGVSQDLGIYIADQIKITKWFEVLGSVRLDDYWFHQNAPAAITALQHLERSDPRLPSWRVGAVVHPTEKTSIYVMRGTSFNPSADNLSISVTNLQTALSLISLQPEKSQTTEIGAKAEILNGKMTLQTAAFNTVKTNLRVPDPANNGVTVLDGAVTARGWEASAAGYLTDAWQVITSYAFTHARITKTINPVQLNAELQNTPVHAFSLWTTYDVTKQLQVGGGAFYNSSVWGDLQSGSGGYTVANTALVPAWWRFDLMAAYKINPKVTLQFNIYNLMDKLYYESAYTNWAVPGASRTFSLTLRGHI